MCVTMRFVRDSCWPIAIELPLSRVSSRCRLARAHLHMGYRHLCWVHFCQASQFMQIEGIFGRLLLWDSLGDSGGRPRLICINGEPVYANELVPIPDWNWPGNWMIFWWIAPISNWFLLGFFWWLILRIPILCKFSAHFRPSFPQNPQNPQNPINISLFDPTIHPIQWKWITESNEWDRVSILFRSCFEGMERHVAALVLINWTGLIFRFSQFVTWVDSSWPLWGVWSWRWWQDRSWFRPAPMHSSSVSGQFPYQLIRFESFLPSIPGHSGGFRAIPGGMDPPVGSNGWKSTSSVLDMQMSCSSV